MFYAGMFLAVLLLAGLFVSIQFNIEARFKTGPFLLEVEVRTVMVRIKRQYGGDYFYFWIRKVAKQPRILSVGDYYRLFQQGVKHMIIERMSWNTVLGLDDAMQTALGTGSVWALKGSLAAWISSHSRLQDLNLEVKPDFSHITCNTNLSCILKMRIAHIIFIIIQAASLYVRGYIRGTTAGKSRSSH